ncbi:MAG: hypothetical protein M1817_004117 [Caeruleum heppii]|nr:MAG: hypothetical protein M1817_004117 [Caeruleum heppii]
MAAPRTVIDHKKAFLSSQVRLLSVPLQPPRHWQDRLPTPDEGDLRGSVVGEVLYKLNVVASHHAKASYSSQALRHVAEQIDTLYWASGRTETDTNVEETLERGLDWTKDSLSKQRSTTREALQQQRHLQHLLDPFRHPQQTIQPNLVTKDGELGKELDRMRILMARVGGRLGELEGTRPRGDTDEGVLSEKEKIAALLGSGL